MTFGHTYCPWLTPTVVSLAQAAYADRPGRKCDRCGGCGYVEKNGSEHPCPDCRKGRIEDGSLDPVRLAILADALEEAGCDSVECETCEIDRKSGQGTTRLVLAGAVMINSGDGSKKKLYLPDCRHCCGSGRRMNPILAHLRSPGPHVRGCWVVDLLLGRQ